MSLYRFRYALGEDYRELFSIYLIPERVALLKTLLYIVHPLAFRQGHTHKHLTQPALTEDSSKPKGARLSRDCESSLRLNLRS